VEVEGCGWRILVNSSLRQDLNLLYIVVVFEIKGSIFIFIISTIIKGYLISVLFGY